MAKTDFIADIIARAEVHGPASLTGKDRELWDKAALALSKLNQAHYRAALGEMAAKLKEHLGLTCCDDYCRDQLSRDARRLRGTNGKA